MFWALCWELKCRDPWQSYFHAVARLRIKGSLQKKKEKKENAKMNSYHCQWPHLIACNMLSLCHIRTSNTTLSFPSVQRVGFSLHESRRQLCSWVFSHFRTVLPSWRGKKKQTVWGDFWATAGYEVEHQPPPECLESSGGERHHDVSGRITSHGAPSETKVYDHIRLYNRRRDRRRPRSNAVWTIAETHVRNVSPAITHI